jgi:hypothetical protein
MSHKYLLTVEYIGSAFRLGLVFLAQLMTRDIVDLRVEEPGEACRRVSMYFLRLVDEHGLMTVLQAALRHLKTAQPPVTVISSRTDTGVNALGNTFHVEMTRVGKDGQVRQPPPTFPRHVSGSQRAIRLQDHQDVCQSSPRPQASPCCERAARARRLPRAIPVCGGCGAASR